MPTTVVRWGDLPHINVSRPTIYGNLFATGPDTSHGAAVKRFEAHWAAKPAAERERLLYAIRGQRITCRGNCSFKGLQCHAVSLARMADELPDKEA